MGTKGQITWALVVLGLLLVACGEGATPTPCTSKRMYAFLIGELSNRKDVSVPKFRVGLDSSV